MLAEGSRPVKGRIRLPSFHGEHAANRTSRAEGRPRLSSGRFTGNRPGPGRPRAFWFHGKHRPSEPDRRARHHRGRRPGTPARRGHRPRAGSGAVNSAIPAPSPRRNSGPSRPNSPSPAAGQRFGSGSPGGSLTTRRPPAPRKPTAHSAVLAGDPKARATTRSNVPRSSRCRASSSARPQATDARSLSPSPLTAASRNAHRRRRASSKTPVAAGHRTSRIRPGTPAPEPRSRNRPPKSPPTAAAIASA
jgi:hypothetical protein